MKKLYNGDTMKLIGVILATLLMNTLALYPAKIPVEDDLPKPKLTATYEEHVAPVISTYSYKIAATKPKDIYGVPKHPENSYGPPKEKYPAPSPAKIYGPPAEEKKPKVPAVATYTYKPITPAKQYGVPELKPISTTVKSVYEAPIEVYGPPKPYEKKTEVLKYDYKKPAETYGVPTVKPAEIYGPPVVKKDETPITFKYVYTIPVTQAPIRPAETYGIPEIKYEEPKTEAPTVKTYPYKPATSVYQPTQTKPLKVYGVPAVYKLVDKPVISTYTYDIPQVKVDEKPATVPGKINKPFSVYGVPDNVIKPTYSPSSKPYEASKFHYKESVAPVVSTYTYEIPISHVKPDQEKKPAAVYGVPVTSAPTKTVYDVPAQVYGVPDKHIYEAAKPIITKYTYNIPEVSTKPADVYGVPKVVPHEVYGVPH